MVNGTPVCHSDEPVEERTSYETKKVSGFDVVSFQDVSGGDVGWVVGKYRDSADCQARMRTRGAERVKNVKILMEGAGEAVILRASTRGAAGPRASKVSTWGADGPGASKAPKFGAA